MKIIITATAPTGYQLNSLAAFNLDGKGLTRTMEFDSQEEAATYLRNRARQYNDADPCGNDQRLEDMYADIEHGCLTLDAVTARIEEVEENKD